jgi:hypothetical protein
VTDVALHLSRFGGDAANDYMIGRLRRILAGEISAEPVDLNFYAHELRELARYRNLGWPTGQPADMLEARDLWNNAHTATLEEYGLSGGINDLYHPEAIRLMTQQNEH